jgi:hypothetical protein
MDSIPVRSSPVHARRIITSAELADCGLTPAAARDRYPWAVEYVALDDRRPRWLADELGDDLEDAT